jgi:glycine C-acetyltransferase
MLTGSGELREKLADNTERFRNGMSAAGFAIKPGVHPIVPIMLGDASLASGMADDLLEEGIYVIGFSFPVVPRGEARIRVQISAAHTRDDIELAVSAFTRVGKKRGVIA